MEGPQVARPRLSEYERGQRREPDFRMLGRGLAATVCIERQLERVGAGSEGDWCAGRVRGADDALHGERVRDAAVVARDGDDCALRLSDDYACGIAELRDR